MCNQRSNVFINCRSVDEEILYRSIRTNKGKIKQNSSNIHIPSIRFKQMYLIQLIYSRVAGQRQSL
uniref:Uncharacterized protein n=1 Tax=Ciona intestinalis TaxID=7719 RepID=H2XRK2_CIOIN